MQLFQFPMFHLFRFLCVHIVESVNAHSGFSTTITLLLLVFLSLYIALHFCISLSLHHSNSCCCQCLFMIAPEGLVYFSFIVKSAFRHIYIHTACLLINSISLRKT